MIHRYIAKGLVKYVMTYVCINLYSNEEFKNSLYKTSNKSHARNRKTS